MDTPARIHLSLPLIPAADGHSTLPARTTTNITTIIIIIAIITVSASPGLLPLASFTLVIAASDLQRQTKEELVFQVVGVHPKEEVRMHLTCADGTGELDVKANMLAISRALRHVLLAVRWFRAAERGKDCRLFDRCCS
jgi:hypothetical protein